MTRTSRTSRTSNDSRDSRDGKGRKQLTHDNPGRASSDTGCRRRIGWGVMLLCLVPALALGLAACLMSMPAHAQTEEGVTFYGSDKQPPYEVADDGTVRLYMGARELDGTVIELANKDQIRIIEDGVPVDVVSSVPYTDSRAIVVMLDTSGTMWEQMVVTTTPAIQYDSKLNVAVSKAAKFILDLPQPVEVAVTTYRDANTLFQGFTRDTKSVSDRLLKALNNNISELEGKGGIEPKTCLYDALNDAIALLENNTIVRSRSIVLLTDGKDEHREGDPKTGPMVAGCSVSTLSGVIKRAASANVQIFTIGLGEKVDQTALKNLASGTSGLYRWSSTADLNNDYNVFKEIADKSGKPYIVTYKTQANNKDAQLRVEVTRNGETPIVGTLDRVHVPPLKPDLKSIKPSRVVTGTNVAPDPPTVQGKVDIVPEFVSLNRVSRVEYVNKATGEKLGDGAPPSYALKDWDSGSALKGQGSANVEVEARAYGYNDTAPPAVASTKLAVIPAPTEVDWSQYVLFGIGGVAIMTLLLTLFLFLNRGRGGVMAGAARKPASVTKGEPLAQLIVVEGPGVTKPQEHFLYGDRNVGLGRDDDIPIQIPGERVSRQHGEILYRRNQFLYVESKATNGTFIDGQRVAKDVPVPLRDGSEVFFGGQTRAIFRLRQPGQAAAQAPGFVPPAQAVGPQPAPRAMPPVAASELHTTDWVRETPLQTGPQAAPPNPAASGQYGGPHYGGQAAGDRR